MKPRQRQGLDQPAAPDRRDASPLISRRDFLAALTVAGLASSLPAQDPNSTESKRLFRIGYLRRETTGHPGEKFLSAMKNDLWAEDELRRLMQEESFGGIGLFPCDGPADMLRRLDTREFHAAFTPAALYAGQQADYTAILKSRRDDDLFSVDRVYRQGIIIVSRRSALFKLDAIDRKTMAGYLEKEKLAVVSSQSVAGYQAPLLSLSVEYDVRATEGGYLWFDSSEEVVKAVLSGLADIGACEESALVSVLKSNDMLKDREEYVRVILKTDPIPTDPIVVLPQFAPRGSALGRGFREAIRKYSLGGGLGGIQYTTASDQEYGRLNQLLADFQRRVGSLGQ